MTRRTTAGFLRERWWLCVPVALIVLVLVDGALVFWNPKPARLPEQFSAAYLQRYVDANRNTRPIVFAGDSVLWGYRVSPANAAATILSSHLAAPEMNLSYEGGSSVNTYFMLRYLLASGVRPKLFIFNVNSKEGNSLDSAYRRLHPSLEKLVTPLFDAADRQRLTLQPQSGIAFRLDGAVASVWNLYRFRTDLREAIFGADDAAGALKNFVEQLTGSARRQAAAHLPTPDRFMGTYDVSALTSENVDLIYLKKTVLLLRDRGIPAIAFLTPTNHRLLHEYIDYPEYDARLRQLATALKAAPNVAVLNLDRAIPPSEFFDNDHLTNRGNAELAVRLKPIAEKLLRP